MRPAAFRALVLAGLALPASGMTCGPGPSAPEPDDCGAPGEAPAGSVAIGPERLDGHPFEAWGESDTAYITFGPQGGEMLGLSLGVADQAAPDCLAQRSEIRQDGRVLADDDTPVKTYPESDGSRASQTHWLIFPDGGAPALGSEIEVSSEAGGATVAARLAVVADRHRLVSLSPPSAAARVGDTVGFLLASVHAPAYTVFEATVATSDPSVVSVEAATAFIYDDLETLVVQAVGPGSADLVIGRGDDEVRASVTVE